MGMISRFIGLGSAAGSVGAAATNLAEVFTQNQTRRMELDEEAYARAISQLSGEFAANRAGFFDSFVNGMNRLPRPVLTLGTLGLFTYAMVEPQGFSIRMEGLALIPEPLWWLLGAIISFYFGAREAHYHRVRSFTRATAQPLAAESAPPRAGNPADAFADNAALRDWAAQG